MCGIDFNNSCRYNEEIEVKRQAYLDNMYEQERRNNYRSFTNNSNNFIDSSNLEARINSIENRINNIERTVNSLKDLFAKFDQSNGLFVFAPDSNIEARVAFSLTDTQLKEIMNNIR